MEERQAKGRKGTRLVNLGASTRMAHFPNVPEKYVLIATADIGPLIGGGKPSPFTTVILYSPSGCVPPAQ